MLEINTLYHGNCLELIKLLDDNSIDLTLTSPPYNMRTRVRNGKYTKREKGEHFCKKYSNFSDDLSIEEYYDFHKNVLNELLRVSKTIIWNIQIVTGSKEAIFKIIGDFNKNIKDIIIWDKINGQPAMHKSVLNSVVEYLILFENDANAGRAFNRHYWNRGELDNIWRIPRSKHYNGHSATFPLQLANKAILNFSKENDIVLDPFMGCGTTAVACLENNRKYIGFELCEEYINIANNRIKEHLKLS